jgi:hypothetical protein
MNGFIIRRYTPERAVIIAFYQITNYVNKIPRFIFTGEFIISTLLYSGERYVCKIIKLNLAVKRIDLQLPGCIGP